MILMNLLKVQIIIQISMTQMLLKKFLLDFIKPNLKIPPETAESVMMLTKKRFRKQLIDQLLYPEVIPDLKILLEKNYRESLIDPGTSVGILCAQSIGKFRKHIIFY